MITNYYTNSKFTFSKSDICVDLQNSILWWDPLILHGHLVGKAVEVLTALLAKLKDSSYSKLLRLKQVHSDEPPHAYKDS